jgi:Xaa-Pro aminopeptidase
MIIQPSIDDSGNIKATTRFLCPSFEFERVRLLKMPIMGDDGDAITWEEDWNPYQTLRDSWVFGSDYPLIPDTQNRNRKPKVMVDDEMRDFIQRGLSENGFEVVGLGGEVEKVKQVKTEREIDILRAVNTRTVEAIRAVRGCLYLGLREEEVKEVLDNTLRAGGLEPFFDIVLFGTSSHLHHNLQIAQKSHAKTDENASNPHGGTNGSKVLEKTTLVLIDVGYVSHISPTSPSQPESLSPLLTNRSPEPTYTATPQT